MAGYPQNTLKLVIGGNILSDIWRTSLDYNAVTTGPGVPPDAADMNAICAALAPSVAAWWTAIKAFNNVQIDYRFLSAYWYRVGETTAYSQGQTTIAAVPGSTAANYQAYRTAIVVSKYTGFAGRSERGRMYLPMTAPPNPLQSGQLTQANCDSIAAATRTFIQDSEAVDLSAMKVASHRACVTSSRATHVGHPITSIRVDSLPDTQRRRTNAAQALFSTTAVVT